MTADDIESITGEAVDLEELEERAEIPIEEVSEAIKIPLNPRFGPYKKDLIRDIKKLTDQFSDRQLQRSRKEDLVRILAEQMETKIVQVQSPPELAQVSPDKRLMIGSMYRISLAFCGLLEGASKKFQPMGYCIHNYANTVDQPRNREVIMDVLGEIWDEHSEVLQAYCSKESRLFLVFGLALVTSVRKYSPIMENEVKMEPSNLDCKPAQCRQNQYGPIPDTQGGAIRFAGGYNNRFQQRGGVHPIRVPAGTKESTPCLSSARTRRDRSNLQSKRGTDSKGKDSGKSVDRVRRLPKQDGKVQQTSEPLFSIREDKPHSATGFATVDKPSGHNLEVEHGLLHNVQTPDTKRQDVCLGKPDVRGGENEKGGVRNNGKDEAVSGPRS
jgi:hypothetical protein